MVPAKKDVEITIPVKTTMPAKEIKYVVVKNSPPPPPLVKVEAPVPEVVVSGTRLYPSPPADVRLALLPFVVFCPGTNYLLLLGPTVLLLNQLNPSTSAVAFPSIPHSP